MTTALAPRPTMRTAGNPATPGHPVSAPSTDTLSVWAARIDADGIAAHEDAAQRLAAVASSRGLCPVLVDVLADPREPSVARERAFGRLALSLQLAA